MLKKLTKAATHQPRPSDTMIAHDVTVTGALTSNGDIVIDGTFEGSITSQGHVRIGAGGLLTADIKCRSLTIDGTLTGTATASDEVFINPTGQVRGDVSCRQLDVALGGIINGQVQTEDHKPSPARDSES